MCIYCAIKYNVHFRIRTHDGRGRRIYNDGRGRRIYMLNRLLNYVNDKGQDQVNIFKVYSENAIDMSYYLKTIILSILNLIWALSRENLSLEVCEQQRRRPAYASAQSDQCLC